MAITRRFRLGTRASQLARWQAQWVAERLGELGIETELVLISTQGDERSGPIGNIGTQGVFTKEIQRALLEDRVDLAVHSLKDLPTEPVDGLLLAAVPIREVNSDVLVSNQYAGWEQLPEGSRVGTGSARRRAQLLHHRPEIEVLDIRGNVETRLRKLDEGQYEAIVLAEAGLRRLGLEDRITQVLPRDWMLPAVGQGALGIETRADDAPTRAAVGQLDHAESHAAVRAERSLLAALRGGCLAPVGAWGRREGEQLRLDAAVLSVDGKRRLTAGGTGPLDEAEALGRSVAEALTGQGAGELIRGVREPGERGEPGERES